MGYDLWVVEKVVVELATAVREIVWWGEARSERKTSLTVEAVYWTVLLKRMSNRTLNEVYSLLNGFHCVVSQCHIRCN